ncbi:hypothetical protein LTR42_002823 [Elasticomyces elasticus]|nr:hypothetical protein LTR42_002823 [Elasticomyces elasticus]
MTIPDEFCQACKQISLQNLFASVTYGDFSSSRRSLRECEEQGATIIPDLTFAQALENKGCPLCRLIIACGEQVGLLDMFDAEPIVKETESAVAISHDQNAEDAATSPVDQSSVLTTPSTVRICLRPKLVWSHDNLRSSGPAGTGRATLVSEGQFDIWYYKLSQGSKLERVDSSEYGGDGGFAHWLRDRFRRVHTREPPKPAVRLDQDPGYEDLAEDIGDEDTGEDSTGDEDLEAQDVMPEAAEYEESIDETITIAKPERTKYERQSRWTFKEIKSDVATATVDIVSFPRKFAREEPVMPEIRLSRAALHDKADCARLRSWLHTCKTLHDHSSLDVVARTRLDSVTKLYSLDAINTTTGTIDQLPKDAEYAALSYVWEQDTLPAESDTLTHAPIIRDAIALARELGFQWLWINLTDSLERQALIPVIKDIFSLAEITIVAGHDASLGLSGFGETSRVAEVTYDIPWTEHQCAQCLPTLPTFDAMQGDFTWQAHDQVFSRRLLYVFPTDVVFSCERGMFRESTGERSIARQLLAPIEDDEIGDSGCSSRDYEEARAVWIPGLTFATALQNTQCSFCKLIVECAYHTDLQSHFDLDPPVATRAMFSLDLDRPSQRYQATMPHTVRCHIRPKLTWSNTVGDLKKTRRIVNEGHIHIRFCRSRARELGTSGALGDITQPSYWQSDRDPSYTRDEADPTITSWVIEVLRSRCGIDGGLTGPGFRITIPPRISPSLVLTWLHACETVHKSSVSDIESQARLSLVRANHALKVIDTSTYRIVQLPADNKYVALSYVWGSNAEGLGGRSSARDIGGPAAFPPTIMDALALASELKYRWLWVDRYCINQHDAEEKAALIPIMKDIFGLADLTIVAAGGNDAYAGLAGVRDHTRAGEEPKEVAVLDGESVYVVPARPSFNKLLEETKWRTRGWTFSEQIFSRRLLYIFPSETIFACERITFKESTGAQCFTGITGRTWDSSAGPPSIESLIDVKLHTTSGKHADLLNVQNFVLATAHYTSRELSFEEDRIIAFAGVIAMAHASTDTPTQMSLLKHGHPLECFETALTWHTSEECTAFRSASDGNVVAPSWSWASAGARVRFLDDGQGKTRNRFFQYELLNGYDVLGVPNRAYNEPFSKLGLPYPTHIMALKPWDHGSVHAASRELETNPASYAQDAIRELPRLHLLTIIFVAILQPLEDGQLSMIMARGRTRVTGQWSLSLLSGLRAARTSESTSLLHNITDQRSQQIYEPGSSTSQTFAVVGGHSDLYIMLLAPHAEPDMFSRLGLLKVSSATDKNKLSIVMHHGHAAWQYIQLV